MGRGPTIILVGPTLTLVVALLHSAPALDLGEHLPSAFHQLPQGIINLKTQFAELFITE